MEKINAREIKGVPETMLIPLWCRASETNHKTPIIRDPKAVEMISMIDYDFSKFKSVRLSQIGVSIRTEILDIETRRFLEHHKGAVVVNMGCGLDTRAERLRDAGASVWYDLDLPEVMQLRRHFFKEDDYLRFIEGSVFDDAWMHKIDHKGKPVLFIAEGLFMYFPESMLRDLFDQLAARFNGAEILFEMLAPMFVGRSKRHDAVKKTGGAEFKWSLKKARMMEAWNPAICYMNEWDYFDYHRDRVKSLRFFLWIPGFKRNFSNRIVHLKFDRDERHF